MKFWRLSLLSFPIALYGNAGHADTKICSVFSMAALTDTNLLDTCNPGDVISVTLVNTPQRYSSDLKASLHSAAARVCDYSHQMMFDEQPSSLSYMESSAAMRFTCIYAGSLRELKPSYSATFIDQVVEGCNNGSHDSCRIACNQLGRKEFCAK